MANQKGIPHGIVDEIRERADIAAIVGDHVLLKKTGANLSGLCPFHSEKTPSFTVHPGKKIFHCFGCGAGGDVFTFLMRTQNISFPIAVEKLAGQVGIDLSPYREPGQDVDFDHAHKMMAEAGRLFASSLASTSEPLDYLANRGIDDATIRDFGIGFARDDWKELGRNLQKKGYSPEDQIRFGLSRKGKEQGSYDYFRGRIMFPIHDEYGKPVGFGGRIIGDGQPKYLNSPESALYNKGRLLFNLHRAAPVADGDTLLLVEGYMDVVALWQHGFKNAVATLGTALTEAQIRKLAKTCKRLVFAYDADAAGVKATLRALPLLEKSDLDVSMLRLPEGVDPDDFVTEHGADALRQRLEAGLPVETFLFEATRARHANWQTPEGRRAALKDLSEVFRLLPSIVSQQNFVERIADSFSISEDLVRRSLISRGSDRAAAAGVAAATATKPRVLSPLVQAERTLIHCYLTDVAFYWKTADQLRISQFLDPYCRRILQLLPEIGRESGEVVNRLLSTVEDDELQRFVTAELMLRPVLTEETATLAVKDCLREIRRNRLEARKKELLRLVSSDGAGDEMLREFKEVTEELQSLMQDPEEAENSDTPGALG